MTLKFICPMMGKKTTVFGDSDFEISLYEAVRNA